LDSARLEAFSDGVFAVAITVLALTLAVPVPGQVSLGRQLTDHWPSFAAFAISFLTIGIIWVNHHTLFKNFAKIDRTLLFINLLLLFFVVTIPFATATMASYLRSGGAGATGAAVIYQGVLEGMSLAFGVLFWWSVKKEHLKVAFTPAEGRAAVIRFGAGNVAYLAAIGIAFASAPVSLLVSGLVAVYYIFEHTPARPAEDAEGTEDPDPNLYPHPSHRCSGSDVDEWSWLVEECFDSAPLAHENFKLVERVDCLVAT
jgi:uncharacterized membrane protein